MDFITFNPNKTNLVDGDFLKDADIVDRIYEDGSFVVKEQFMSFDCEGVSITIDYEINVSGKSYYDKGDYWTPPSYDVNIDSIDITINSVTIDEYEVELTSDLNDIFENLVTKSL